MSNKERVRGMLRVIPSHQYVTWMNVLQSLTSKSLGLSVENAWELFDEWSKRTKWSNYDRVKNEKTFREMVAYKLAQDKSVPVDDFIKFRAGLGGWKDES